MTRDNIFKKSFLNKRYDILICLFLSITTFSVYWQIHQYDFVSFDDNEYVYDNPHVKSGITLKNIIWAFTAFHSNNWHPLTWMSHMLDCQLFGLNAGCHHFINLLFHVANTLLLFLIFKQMTGSLWKSSFIAAIFALHPLHVESVAWIAERKDVLSAFFWMLTMWSYIRYTMRPTIYKYLMTIIFFAFGLMSKPMVVTLPFVLLLIDYWPLNRFQSYPLSIVKKGRSTTRLILEKAPFLILAPISCFLTYFAQKHGGVIKSLDVFSLKIRLANALISYISYIGKMIYPSKLAFLYPHPGMAAWWKITGSCLLLAVISLLAIKNIKKRPYFIVGWLWYLGTLVPVIGIVQVGMQSMADRYTYIPSIGVLIIIAWSVSELVEHWKHKILWLTAATTVVVSIFTVITWEQIGYWKNSKVMFEHTLEVTTNNYIAHDSLGVEFFNHGNLKEAIYQYSKALQIKPDYHFSHFNIGVAFFQQGRIEDAIDQYIQAIDSEPNYFKARNNLGAAFFVQGKTEKAIKQYMEALKIKPDYIDAHINLAMALDKQGYIEEAIKEYKQALLIDPNNITAHFNLGSDLEKVGIVDEAINHYLQSLTQNPNFVEAHYALGVVLYKQGKLNEAIQHDMQVLRLKPDNPEAHNNLGSVFYQQGHINEAIDQYLQALRIKPDYAEAHNNLGVALFLKRDINAAIASFQEALRINPNYASAKNNLQKVLMMQQKGQ